MFGAPAAPRQLTLVAERAAAQVVAARDEEVVASVLERMVWTVESACFSEKRDGLQRLADSMRKQKDTDTEQWRVLSATLSREEQALRHEVEAVTQSLSTAKHGLQNDTDTAKFLKQQEEFYQHRKESRTAIRDISRLPRIVLRHVVSFLRSRDLARAVCCCRRWNYYLDRGYIWKPFVVQHHSAGVDRRKRAEENEVQVQRSVTITLERPPKSKGALSKDEMFAMCLEQVMAQCSQMSSEREDMLSRARAEREVRSFLEKTLEGLKHQMGVAAVELGAWEQKMAGLQRSKADLSRRIGDLEQKLVSLRSEAAETREAMNREAKELDSKIHMLSELKSLSEMSRSPAEKEKLEAANSELKELKAQKKALVKAVKTLRADLDQAIKIRDTYSLKLRKLKASGTSAPVDAADWDTDLVETEARNAPSSPRSSEPDPDVDGA